MANRLELIFSPFYFLIRMKTHTLCQAVLLVILLLFPTSGFTQDRLTAGFHTPPDEAKLWAYWWWLNGNVTETAITRDLTEMHDKGFGGLVLFDANGSNQDGNKNVPPGPTYNSPEWRRLFEHAIKEADRLGMSISLNIQSGWNLGGPLVTPEYAAKHLTYSSTTIDGGTAVDVVLAQPNTRNNYYRDIAVVAFKERDTQKQPPFSIHASSTQKESDPKHAADGTPSSHWVSNGYNPGDGPTDQKPEWLEFRFAHPTEVNRVTILPRAGYGPTRCTVDVYESEDSAGRTVATLTAKPADETVATFPKVKVKRVRLNMFGASDPPNPQAPRNVQIVNFALYNEEQCLTDLEQAMGRLRLLDIKLSFRTYGGSAPDCSPLLADEPHIPGEEAANVEDVLVLTEQMDEKGRLMWNAPPGKWTVLRFGCTPNGVRVSTSSADWQGLVLDYLSKEAFDYYWAGAVQPIIEPVKQYCGRTLRYLHHDSWEAGGMNWTNTFRDEFQKRRGYDPIPYFPIIAGHILNDRTVSNRFLNDFRRTIGDMVVDNHYRNFASKAAEYGLGIHPESGGPHGAPIDSLQLLGLSNIPMSEFWCWSPRHRVGEDNRFFTKQPASAAHTNSRKIVAAEGFTNIGMHWRESFSDNLKPSFDQAVCEGMNLLVWHAVVCSPDETGFPGQEYFAGTYFHPKHFTWQKSKGFLMYMNRVHFLLQQGLPSVDVLEFYGDNVPNFTQRKGKNTAKSLPGYDYDVASQSVLLNQIAGVQNGKIVLKDGVRYRVLVLPNRSSMSLETLQKVEELVRGGATVIGPKPERTTGLGDDAALKAIADRLWNEKQGIQGRVIRDKTAHDFLKAEGVPFDFQRIDGSNLEPRLDWVHRTLYRNQLEKVSLRKFAEFSPMDVNTIPADEKSGIGAEIYYVANLTDKPDDAVCAFRVTGRQPELWNPVSVEIRDAKAFTQKEGTTLLPLKFEPFGSLFVVFQREINPDVNGTALSNDWKVNKAVEITKPWLVRFDPKWGGPEKPVEFATLTSWTEHADPAIRFYSGIATYSQDVDVKVQPGDQVFLEVGNVGEMAEVKVNGQSCGFLWAVPYRLDITKALKSGTNRIEIEVANHWANRVIGDAALPESERLTKTNIQRVTAETPLVDSGLLGSARLIWMSLP